MDSNHVELLFEIGKGHFGKVYKAILHNINGSSYTEIAAKSNASKIMFKLHIVISEKEINFRTVP